MQLDSVHTKGDNDKPENKEAAEEYKTSLIDLYKKLQEIEPGKECKGLEEGVPPMVDWFTDLMSNWNSFMDCDERDCTFEQALSMYEKDFVNNINEKVDDDT